MIVACPLCQTRFLVAAGLFAGGARAVRCGSCRHVWKASLGVEETVGPGFSDKQNGEKTAALATTQKESLLPPQTLSASLADMALAEARATIVATAAIKTKEKSVWGIKWLTRRILIAAILFFLLLAIAIGGAVARHEIAERWPFMERFYDKIGLDSHQPGDGIDFHDMKSELVYDGGILRLTVGGRLVNTTENEQKVPNILAIAIGSDGSEIQRWRIDAPAATLLPHGTVTFHSVINAPREGVVNVNLNFVGRKNGFD